MRYRAGDRRLLEGFFEKEKSMRRIITALMAAALFTAGLAVQAAVPSVVSYQGKLTDLSGQPVTDGTYIMDFSIYTDSSRGTPVWVEPGRSVQVSGGVFTVLLGEQSPLSASVFAGDRWLGVIVNGIELTPRTKLASAPYAFRAHTAEHVLSSAAVTSLNSLTGSVALAAGDNITITPTGNTLTISSSQDIPNPLPVTVQNQPTVRIDPNHNVVKAPTQWAKQFLWDTNQTVAPGFVINSNTINTAGFKEMRVHLALQASYSSPQDIEVQIYARAGGGTLSLIGSAHFGPESTAFIREGSFSRPSFRLLLNIPVISEEMRITIRNNRTSNIVVTSACWAYLVN